MWKRGEHNRKSEWISNMWKRGEHNRKSEWISNMGKRGEHNRKSEWISNMGKELEGFEEGNKAKIQFYSLRASLKKVSNNKKSGYDGIHGTSLKNSLPLMIDWLSKGIDAYKK